MIQFGVCRHHERDRHLDQSDEEVDEEDCAIRFDEWVAGFGELRDNESGRERSSRCTEESQDLEDGIEFR